MEIVTDNKALYQRVADKLNCDPELVSFLVNRMFYRIDRCIREKDRVSIKIPGFAKADLSLHKVNGVLRNKSIVDLRSDRTNQEFIDKFRQLWAIRQRLIKFKRTMSENKPKRYG